MQIDEWESVDIGNFKDEEYKEAQQALLNIFNERFR